MTPTPERYSTVAIWLHWIIVPLMIFMLFFSEDLIKLPRGASIGPDTWQPTAHASFGFLVLLLGLARLFWRLGHTPPPLPAATPRWQIIASHVTHAAFYVLLIAIPLFGLLALAPYGVNHAGVENVTFFKLFSLAFMPNLGHWTSLVHELLGKLAQVLVIIHVVAALKHQFWDRDGLLGRMRPI
jgi:cytochrome b561